jgi:D-arabinono-1,4-lactone oxidase
VSVERAADGFFHPATEQQIVELVARANREGRQLRVRGAAHSVAWAIYPDPHDDLPDRVSQEGPPAGDGITIMLDQYRGWRIRDAGRKLIEVDAGLNLGADPNDPTGTATLENSLLSQLARQQGWSLHETGGITHQTVSGFTATGSAGGSVIASCQDNLHGFRVVDGAGVVHEVTRDDADPGPFLAMSPSLGLLGVVSTVILECVEAFDISGHEAITTVEGCAVDVFGDGADGRPALEAFLRDKEFARLEWWPQRGGERMVVWQAVKLAAEPGFQRRPYSRFGPDPETQQYLTSFFYTILGNLKDLRAAKPKLVDDFDGLDRVLARIVARDDLGEVGRVLAHAIGEALRHGVDALLDVLQPAAPLIEQAIPDVFPKLIPMFVEVDGEKPPQAFQDTGWQGLPMDNQADDTIVPTEFTELWVPLGRAREVMGLLHDYFTAPRSDHESYRRTGLYAWELYAAKPNDFWLNPSYSDGADEWAGGALRIDPYWFAENADDPATTLYAGLWSLLAENAIPTRLHRGKFHPPVTPGDRTWVHRLAAQYPHWDDFLALRAQRDPNNIFLTSYWRDRLGLWDAPAPVAQGPHGVRSPAVEGGPDRLTAEQVRDLVERDRR